MAFLTRTHRKDGSVYKLAMFFALGFVAVGVVLGTVLERFERLKPLATRVRSVPRLVTRLKERTA
jgi:hypothetical protein